MSKLTSSTNRYAQVELILIVVLGGESYPKLYMTKESIFIQRSVSPTCPVVTPY